jgi:hypothetical protein
MSRISEVDRNYEVFRNLLAELSEAHPGEYAIMHDGQVIDFFDTFRDAVLFGHATFGEGRFSVQEVTGQRVSLGFHGNAIDQLPD